MLGVFFSALIIVLTREGISARRDTEILSTLDILETVAASVSSGKNTLNTGNIPYFIMYRLSIKNGRVLQTNDPMIPELPVTEEGKTGRIFRENFFSDGNLNLVYAAKDMEFNTITYHIQAAIDIDMDTLDKYMLFMPVIFLICSIPILVISWIISWRTTTRMLKPVKLITKQAQEIGSEHLDRRLDEGETDDELKVLAHTFNELFARLEKDFEHEKRFTSDVSHELKTPIAVISGHVDLLMRWGKDNPEVLEESLKVLKRETQSMANLTEQLLELNRAHNAARLPYEKKTLNLVSFLQSIKDDFKLIEPGVKIEIESINPEEILTDAESLREILRIIIKNGILYNDSPTPEITIRFENGILSVRDNGIGIPEEDIPHIFDSFYRVDKSRNRSKGGTGIGLAIAKSVAEKLGAVISVESKTGKGTVMHIRL